MRRRNQSGRVTVATMWVGWRKEGLTMGWASVMLCEEQSCVKGSGLRGNAKEMSRPNGAGEEGL